MTANSSALSWRIPSGDDPLVMRGKVLRSILASVLGGAMIYFLLPFEALIPASLLFGALACSITAYHYWRFRQSLLGDDNIWLDAAGFHWLDAKLHKHNWPRELISGYSITTTDRDTFGRPTIIFERTDGFRSQPIQIRHPADSESVRTLMESEWNLSPLAPGEQENKADYDQSIDVYHELDEDYNTWHFEGTCDSLAELATAIRQAAESIPLPPPGARAKQAILLLSRRDPSRVAIAVDRRSAISADGIVSSREFLESLAAEIEKNMPVDPAIDASFRMELAPRQPWHFYLHVRPKIPA